MEFASFEFFIFFPIVVLINYIIPRRYKYIWMFVTSLVFCASISIKSLFVLIAVILLTYGLGLLLDKAGDDKTKKKTLLILSLVLTIGILVVCKYLNFLASIMNSLFGDGGDITGFNLLATAGISFYMLKAIGYLIDVYRGDLAAEKNIIKYALFVSFFPQITAGPIERAGNMLHQFAYPLTVDFYRLRDGLLQMLWGYFLKMVIADRLAIFVNGVYGNLSLAVGLPTLVATVFYSFEIYCDFAAYTHISLGAARILGIDVMKNFDCPYLASSVAEFWRRWHISLSTWFRDYLYIPLGGNRKGTARKYLNIMIVFAVSGLWHGADWTFVVWGLLHGIYQVIGYIMKPARDKFISVFNVNRRGFSHRFLRILVTFILVNYAWVFFKAASLSEAFMIIRSSLVFTPWKMADGSLLGFGLDSAEFMLSLLGIGITVAVDVINYFGITIREKILSQGIWLRYLIGIFGIIIVLIFGIWGPGYESSNFIYQQF